MTKEALLSIKGLQYGTDGEIQETETILPAEYYYKNETHYVLYAEYDETGKTSGGPVKNRIRFRADYLEVVKREPVNTRMVFEENFKHHTIYTTPYGDMNMGLYTRNLHLTHTKERILMLAEYALELNHVYTADCKICIKIEARDSACSAGVAE